MEVGSAAIRGYGTTVVRWMQQRLDDGQTMARRWYSEGRNDDEEKEDVPRRREGQEDKAWVRVYEREGVARG